MVKIRQVEPTCQDRIIRRIDNSEGPLQVEFPNRLTF